MKKLTNISIAVDFSQRVESSKENRAKPNYNAGKARLPIFHAIRQLKLTAI